MPEGLDPGVVTTVTMVIGGTLTAVVALVFANGVVKFFKGSGVPEEQVDDGER